MVHTCHSTTSHTSRRQAKSRRTCCLTVVCACLASAITTTTLVAATDHGHSHGHTAAHTDDAHAHESCGCAAAEGNWTIDCGDTSGVLASYSALVSNRCFDSTTCATAQCSTHWQSVVAHHSHCPPDQFPGIVEIGFHEFEDACGEGCEIGRQYNPSLATCPTPTCNVTTPLSTALTALQTNACATSCGSSVCVDNYRTLRAYHDLCDDASGVDNIHQYEEACSAAECNTVNGTFNPNVCEHDDDHDEHDEHDEEDHDDHDHEACGCVAAENGWSINCNNQGQVLAAYGNLAAFNCMSPGICASSPACHANWQLVVAHHDYCGSDDLPNIIEIGFHEFEEACGEGCEIGRQYNASLATCPTPTCNATTPLSAALTALQTNTCATSCGSSVCVDNYRTLRAYHDLCHDVSGVDNIHQYEEACNAAECNTVNGTFNPNVCEHDDEHDDHDEEDHDHDHEQCGCVAAEHGWTIDCTDSSTVLNAFATLIANDCMAPLVCMSSVCAENWQILSAHHSHCGTNDLPSIIETGYHEFEEACGEACEIGRQYNASLAACPTPTCDSAAPLSAALTALQTNACATSCGSSVCVDNYRTLRAYHDLCDDASGVDSIHQYEEACGAAECNTVNGAFNPNVCNGVVNTSSQSSSTSNDDDNMGLIIGLSVVTAVAILAALVMYHSKQRSIAAFHKQQDKVVNPVYHP